MSEEIVPIPGYEGYGATRSGAVWSRWTTASKLEEHWVKKLVPSATKRGYLRICPKRDGRQSSISVHQVVMLAFVGPPGPGQEVRHKDGVPSNCSLENLCYGTKVENEADKKRHGTAWNQRGERHPCTKLTTAAVRTMIYLVSQGCSQAMVSRLFDTSPMVVNRAVHFRNWRGTPRMGTTPRLTKYKNAGRPLSAA
jgi:hypothetical protein